MHTEGLMLLQGFGIYRTYFKEAIDTLKIDWNIFRAGTHKSFGEPFTRNDMSDEDRESLSRIIEQLWATYTGNVALARNLQPEAVDGLVENYAQYASEEDRTLPEIIVDLGFVDELLTRPQLQERIARHAGHDDDSTLGYRAAGLDEYLAQMRLLDGEPETDSNVAVVVAAGEILPGSQPPGTVGADSTAALLAQARDDDNVQAVVLRVDSPGGSAFASEVIRTKSWRCRKQASRWSLQ
ncbi:MAG: S49 family peptidase [Woeseiaceae bacterium]|nr:S49 family peptidase [Woeseiaceae bacterium]